MNWFLILSDEILLSDLQDRKFGKYEVHESECSLLADAQDRTYLGPFNNGLEALRRAKEIDPNVSLCMICCAITNQPVIFKIKETQEGQVFISLMIRVIRLVALKIKDKAGKN